jgi:hypothetical protein
VKNIVSCLQKKQKETYRQGAHDNQPQPMRIRQRASGGSPREGMGGGADPFCGGFTVNAENPILYLLYRGKTAQKPPIVFRFYRGKTANRFSILPGKNR